VEGALRLGKVVQLAMNLTTLFSGASLLRFMIDVAVIIIASIVIKRGVSNQIVAQYKAAAEAAALVASVANQLADVNAATCESLRNQIAEHGKQILEVHRELGGLQKENEFLRARNIELQKEIAELREENKHLKDRLSSLENGVVKAKRQGGSK
jgi:chromosome segregation ATPase